MTTKVGTRRLLFLEGADKMSGDHSRNVLTMAYRNRIASVVIVVVTCVTLDGCARVKTLVPWGKSGSDASATTSAQTPGDAGASTANDPSKSQPPGDRDVSSDSRSSSDTIDASTAPVDLSVPRVPRNQSAINDPLNADPATVAGSTTNSAATSAPQSVNPASNGSTGVDDWGRVVQQAIRSHWIQPRGPNIPTDFSCDVMVKITPFGGVDDVKVVRSCGAVALDASIETAVRDSSPLPTPKDPADFSDTLSLTFTPR